MTETEDVVVPATEPTTEEVTLPKAKYDQIVEELANETQSKTNLVEEIKELREKKQIAESEAEESRKKLEAKEASPAGEPGATPENLADVATAAITKVLAEKDSSDAQTNRTTALAQFKETHKEFHPDNDEGGLKFSAFEKKLNRFNLDGLKTESDFLAVFDDARALTVGFTPTTEDSSNPNPLAPSREGSGSAPKETDNATLSSKETKIINETFGGDKDRYLKIKAKRPDYVAQLLQYTL